MGATDGGNEAIVGKHLYRPISRACIVREAKTIRVAWGQKRKGEGDDDEGRWMNKDAGESYLNLAGLASRYLVQFPFTVV